MADEQEIRKAIAEFMGWDVDPDAIVYYREEQEGSRVLRLLRWDSLDTMHEVALKLAERGKAYDYYVALHDIALDGRPEVPLRYFVGRHLLLLTEATAEQRARAAYAVISQQKEG